MSREDCAGDAAVYILGALEDGETAAYGRHLQMCAVCADEVAVLGRVTAPLPMAAPQYRAPPRLRRRVMRTVRAQSRRTRVRPRLRVAVAGAMTILLVVAVAATLARGGLKIIHATVRGSTGTAEVRINGGRADLIVHHLPTPRTGRIYEVWLERSGSQAAHDAVLGAERVLRLEQGCVRDDRVRRDPVRQRVPDRDHRVREGRQGLAGPLRRRDPRH
jgi:hypothetical protein